MLVLVPLFFLLDAVLDDHHDDIVPFSFLKLCYGQLLSREGYSNLVQSLKEAK
jgi:hypothetical protein